MKNNSLDELIKMVIDISNPSSADTQGDNILLVVAAPKVTGTKTMNDVVVIRKADELLEYGYTTTEGAYIAANVAFSQKPAPEKLLLCVRKTTDGENYETIQTTLGRVASEDFYGFHITDFKTKEDVTAAITWAESNKKLFAFEYTDINECPVTNVAKYYYSYGFFGGNAEGYTTDAQPKENEYIALAVMAKCFGYDPGTESWNYKELVGITPSILSSTEKATLKSLNINTFLRYAGTGVTNGGLTLAGEWIDVIRFRDWLKREMQKNIFNALRTAKKVPPTDAGIGMIEGKMLETLLKGQTVGGICATEYDADGNEIPGFKVVVPKASDLTAEEKQSRKLSGCTFTARLLGAIHLVEVTGVLNY